MKADARGRRAPWPRLLPPVLAALCGCSTVTGKRIKVDANEIGISDPFYVVSKDVFPTLDGNRFEFPLRLQFNSSLYETVTIPYDSVLLQDARGGPVHRCAVDSVPPSARVFPAGAAAFAGSQADSAQSDSTVPDGMRYTLTQSRQVLPPPPAPEKAAPPLDPGKTVKVHEHVKIYVSCPEFRPRNGHDYALRLNYASQSRAGKMEKNELPVFMTVSYNGILTSVALGTSIVVVAVYLGLMMAEDPQ